MKNFALLLALLAACSDEPDTIDEILQDVAPMMPSYELTIDQLVAVYCPGVVYADGVTSYAGVTGTYRRFGIAGAPGELVHVALVAEHEGAEAAGTFTGTRATGELIGGRFAAIGDNPAIGAALALDLGGDGEWDEAHFVLGMRRTFGGVAALCLAGEQRPYLMARTLF